jgi:hypothetical protein
MMAGTCFGLLEEALGRFYETLVIFRRGHLSGAGPLEQGFVV